MITMANRYENAKAIIHLVKYYESLQELIEIWATVRTIAGRVVDREVSTEWGEKRIDSLVHDAIDVLDKDLKYGTKYFVNVPSEDDYPERAQAIETLNRFFKYLYDVLAGKISISKILDADWDKVLADMRTEVMGFIDDRVSPKEYVEPLRVVKQMKDSTLG